MKTPSFFAGLMCLFASQLDSQNLVPNYSFETDSLCPDNYNEVTYCKGWLKSLDNNVPAYNTEYLKTCGTPSFSVPNNTWGYQLAASGNAYMAECSMAPYFQADYRENIYTKLVIPLTTGKSYAISFKISHTNNSQNSSNNFGIKFAMNPNFPVNNFAHVYTPVVVSDTAGWTTIRGSFIADSAYRFIGVGNFFDDAHTISIQTCPNCTYNQWGYYLDDICVVEAVNLVPNYSFETDSACPDNYNEVSYSKGWRKSLNNNVPAYHTEYLNACGTPSFAVPNNTWGYQIAATGQAYMAECTMGPTVKVDYRENIYTKLSAPLSVGQTYQASFKISHTNNSQNASNNFGLKFSTVPDFPIVNYAQVYTPDIITDSAGWTLVSGTFVADSAYQYIGAGNFFDDAHTATTQSCNTCPYNLYGYYLDDICVVSFEGSCTMEPLSVPQLVEKPGLQIHVYPVPAQDNLHIDLLRTGSEKIQLDLMDLNGKVVKNILNGKVASDSYTLDLNVNGLCNGVYLLRLISPEGIQMKKIIISL